MTKPKIVTPLWLIKEAKRHKEYAAQNKEKISKYHQKYYLLNKQRIDRRNTGYYLQNKAHVKHQRKGYYQKNKPQFKMRLLNWEANPENKKRIQKYHAAYVKEQRKIPEKKLYFQAYRAIIWQLNACGKPKTKKTIEYLGYSFEDLKKSLESKFRDGMTWENHGSLWELDHKIPISWLLHTGSVEELKIINSIDNLQPLLKIENRKKGNRWAL